jgi:hypothetical protein
VEFNVKDQRKPASHAEKSSGNKRGEFVSAEEFRNQRGSSAFGFHQAPPKRGSTGKGVGSGGLSSHDEIEGRADFDERIMALEKKIAKKIEKDGRKDLDILMKAGVERKALLRVLACVVNEEDTKGWTDLMRARQAALRSIAGRMMILARDAEERAHDPFSMVQTYFFFWAYGSFLGMKWPKSLAEDPTFPFIVSNMRTLARRWRDQADRFGRFLKRYGNKGTNPGIALFLCMVCIWLRKSKPTHWYALANILTDSFEAAGVRRPFSADWLQKVWKRRGENMLRFSLKFNIGAPLHGTVSPTSSPPSQIPGLIWPVCSDTSTPSIFLRTVGA